MASKEISLKIKGKEKSQLSKNQVKFNQLAAKIERLEKLLIDSESRLNQLLELHTRLVDSEQKKTAQFQLNFAKAIDRKANSFKLGKAQKQKVQDIILEEFDEACQYIEPNEEEKDLYDRWSDVSYQEELQNQIDEQREMLEDYLQNQMGMNINLSDFEDTPEGKAKFMEQMQAEWAKIQQEQEGKANKSKTKTKSQIAREEKEKLQEEMKAKSLKSIYYSLAKVLHPDLEQDTELRIIKEDALKKVTVAFETKDLSTLLKLEMEWIHKETEHLEQLSEDKLKIYIDVLKQQERELKEELDLLYMHPRYQDISGMVNFQTDVAQKHCEKTARTLKKQQKSIANQIKDIESYTDKKLFVYFINDYHEQITQMADFDILSQLLGRW